MSIAITATTSPGTQTVSETLGPGILTNVSVFMNETGNVGCDCLIEVSVVRGGLTDGNRVAHIATAYVNRREPLSWDGFLEIKPGDVLRFTNTGDNNNPLIGNYSLLNFNAEGPIQDYVSAILSANT